MSKEKDIITLARTLASSSASDQYYATAKIRYTDIGLTRQPHMIGIYNVVFGIIRYTDPATLGWIMYGDPKYFSDPEQAIAHANDDSFGIEPDLQRYTELVPNTIGIRRLVTRTITWRDNYSLSEAEELLRKQREEFANYMSTR